MKSALKDPKRSIRDKYIRRRRNLGQAIDQFVMAADDRLTEGGDIHDREQIEALKKALHEVTKLLPPDEPPDPAFATRLNEIFGL